MARYTVQAPDGSTIELEGPDGASQADVIAQAQRLYAERQQAQAAPQGRPIASFERGPSAEDLAAAKAAGQPETTAAGVGGAITRGVAPAAVMAGAGALGAAALGVPAVTGAALGAGALGAAKLLGVDRPFVEKLNELMTRAGVAEPQTAIERLLQSASGSAADVASGVAAGRALQGAAAPMARAAGAILAEQPAAQIASGVGSGAAAQAAQELGLGYGGQLVASIIGGAAGSRAARTAIVPASQAQAAERAIVAEGERIGVPVMTSDIAPPRTFMGKAAQAAGERVPYAGTGPVREAQQAKRVQAVKDFALELNVPNVAQASETVMGDLHRAYKDKLSKYTKQKTDVINTLENAGVMPTTNATKAINEQIKELQGLKSEEFKPVIARLEDWRDSLANQNIVNVEQLRKQFGESFKAPELSSVRSIGQKATNAIYDAINQDMSEFIKQNSGAKEVTKWKSANRAISEMRSDVESSALKSLLSKKGRMKPETIGSLLFSNSPSEVELLHSHLDDAGRANAQKLIVARAMEKATSGDVVSPEKFTAELNRLSPQVQTFFKGDDKRRIEGLTRVLGATRRAAEAGVSTPTGQQVVPAATALAAGQLTGSALGGAAALGGVGLAARLYESAPVRNLLLRLPSTKVGSPEEAAILKRITNAMQARTTTEER